jgi:hypothetical protein
LGYKSKRTPVSFAPLSIFDALPGALQNTRERRRSQIVDEFLSIFYFYLILKKN